MTLWPWDGRFQSVHSSHITRWRKLPVASVFPRIASQVIPKIGASSLASAWIRRLSATRVAQWRPIWSNICKRRCGFLQQIRDPTVSVNMLWNQWRSLFSLVSLEKDRTFKIASWQRSMFVPSRVFAVFYQKSMGLSSRIWFTTQMSIKWAMKKGCLGYKGWDHTQWCGDYNIPWNKDPYRTTRIKWA